MKTSSCGLESFTRSSAATATCSRLFRMLPLLSIISPSEISTSSRLNIFSGCRTPFSYTWKADCDRLVTRCGFLSWTVTLSGTRRVSLLNVTFSSSPAIAGGQQQRH